MLNKLKGFIFEEDANAPAAAQAPATASTAQAPAKSAGASHQAQVVDDEFVQALRGALKSRSTAFTALLNNADKLSSVIPDANMRLRAAFQMLEGRGLKEILGAIDVHSADLESQRLQFARQAEEASKKAIGSKQAELDTIDPSIENAKQQIEALTRNIAALNDVIANNTARKTELTIQINEENQRFEAAKQRFETALTIVKSELEGQRAVVQSALS